MHILLKRVVGVLCVLLGIMFGFLPFVPGIILVLFGLELLGLPLVPWEKVQRFWKRKRSDDLTDKKNDVES